MAVYAYIEDLFVCHDMWDKLFSTLVRDFTQ